MRFPFWPDFKGYRNIELGLSRVYELLARLDNPQEKLPPTIHLAGTNGKGSTLSFLREIFVASGYSTHTYTSPHLVNFNERITLNGAQISDEFLNECLAECKKKAEKSPQIDVTFFEGITVAAFLAFSRVKADVLLLETGMGGRLDATNILPKVLCSIITPIAFDHMDFLGNSLKKIAFEKAGIIKKNCPVIIGRQKKSALQTLENQAFALGSKTKIFAKDWKIKKEKDGFLFSGFDQEIHLPLPSLLGNHQIENAGAAIAAALLLQKKFSISQHHIKSALTKTFWPARLQKITSGKFFKNLPKSCELYLDGSHNLQGAATIEKFLNSKAKILKQVQDDAERNASSHFHHPESERNAASHFRHPELVSGSKPKIFVIFAMLQDKDCAGFLKKISKNLDKLIAIEIPDEPKSRKAQDVVEIAKNIEINAINATNLDEAFKKISSLQNSDEKSLILVCGSLYLAGSFLEQNQEI